MRQYALCCGNSKCQTSQTPLWRKGWVTPDGKTVMLCNACGLHYKKGHYCMYCNQIYRESDADDHSNPWIGCDRCSRWVHQKCEEQNGHECKRQKSYLCPDCRSMSTTSNASVITTNPTTSSNPGKIPSPSVIKKRRKTPVGSRDETPDTPTLILPRHRLSQLSPVTPTSPISPGSNFVLFGQNNCSTPTTPTTNIFDPNTNVMPCWSQLKSSIQNLPLGMPIVSPSTPTTAKQKKRKNSTELDTVLSKKQKKSRTTTTILTTTTHRLNTAGIDALMGAVMVEQGKESEEIPKLGLKITTSVRKGKQTPRKMNADARSAAIALSTDTPTTPTLLAPPLFSTTTMTTTTTTVHPRVDDIKKSNLSLSEEQFYQYQQLILQQQQGHHDGDGELSNDSISSVSSTATTSSTKPVTLLQNTFGSVDKLGNFYGSFNEQDRQQGETSPYGMMDDDEESYSVIIADQRRPQKRTKRSPKNVTTTTTTLTMTTTVSSAPTKSKRLRDRIVKNGGVRTVYASSSETEDSDYEQDNESDVSHQWNAAAKALNISLDEAHDVLTSRFPQAPVLKKMGSLWAICEVIRGQGELRSA
jgi:hypothetical protein